MLEFAPVCINSNAFGHKANFMGAYTRGLIEFSEACHNNSFSNRVFFFM